MGILDFLSLRKNYKDNKGKSQSTVYDLDKLETRINEETGDVIIYRRAVRKDTHMRRSEMTVINLENEDDEAVYYIDRIAGVTLYSLQDKYRDRFKDYKGNSLRDTLYFYTGKEYSDTEKFTYDQLLEIKKDIKEHIKDKKYKSLYCIKNKKGYSDSIESNRAKLVYRDTRNIEGTKEVEDRLIDYESGECVVSISSIRRHTDDFLKKAKELFDIEEVCQPGYTKGYKTERFYTNSAIDLIIWRYKARHPEFFRRITEYTYPASRDCFPKVPTPRVPQNIKGVNESQGSNKDQLGSEQTYPGEE